RSPERDRYSMSFFGTTNVEATQSPVWRIQPMKRNVTLIASIVLLALFPRMVRAQAPTVTITNVDNSKAGQLTVQGSYTFPKGWTVVGVFVHCRPPKGAKGEGALIITKLVQDNKNLTGTFSGTSLVPTGTYDVQALLISTDPNKKGRGFWSDTTGNVQVK